MMPHEGGEDEADLLRTICYRCFHAGETVRGILLELDSIGLRTKLVQLVVNNLNKCLSSFSAGLTGGEPEDADADLV